MTGIQWTDETWNPTTGCDRISPGCDNCYALTMAGRLKVMGQAKYQTDGDPRTSGPGFGLAVHADALTIPLRWREPRRVFVNSMSDLFHAKVPREFIDEVFGVMAVAHRLHGHEFQVLTKRPERARLYLNHGSRQLRGGYTGSTRQAVAYAAHRWAIDRINAGALSDSIEYGDRWPLPGVWLGTSIESAGYVRRADELRETPAAVRFLSAEPLLGPLPSLDLTGIDWLIIGGESGKGARPLELSWVYDLIDRARDAKTAVFVKQLGSSWSMHGRLDPKGGDPDYWPPDLRIREWPTP
jgi:protein gp37